MIEGIYFHIETKKGWKYGEKISVNTSIVLILCAMLDPSGR